MKVAKDMLGLAKHIVNQKISEFDHEKFEDHYEEALTELIKAKRKGKTIAAKPRPRDENKKFSQRTHFEGQEAPVGDRWPKENAGTY